MSHYYGQIKGGRGAATRMGHKNTGIEAHVQSWDKRIQVRLDHQDGQDIYRVVLSDWQRGGVDKVIAEGCLNCDRCNSGRGCRDHNNPRRNMDV